jgi:nitrate reductase beta subunit
MLYLNVTWEDREHHLYRAFLSLSERNGVGCMRVFLLQSYYRGGWHTARGFETTQVSWIYMYPIRTNTNVFFSEDGLTLPVVISIGFVGLSELPEE